jgi:hypothetical protein
MTDMDDDVPTLVFSGTYAEALFLKTLLESGGIEASFHDLRIRAVHIEAQLYVRRADGEHASELVEDFCKHGHHSTE